MTKRTLPFVLSFVLAACSPGGEAKYQPQVGDKARLVIDSGSVLVCVEKACLDEFTASATAGDKYGMAGLLLQKRAFVVDSGTEALVIDRGFEVRKVRIMSGQMLGRAGWVYADRLRRQ